MTHGRDMSHLAVARNERDGTRDFAVVDELSKLSPVDWNGYRETIVKPNRGHYRDVGRYAASVRKRGKHTPSAETTD